MMRIYYFDGIDSYSTSNHLFIYGRYFIHAYVASFEKKYDGRELVLIHISAHAIHTCNKFRCIQFQ